MSYLFRRIRFHPSIFVVCRCRISSKYIYFISFDSFQFKRVYTKYLNIDVLFVLKFHLQYGQEAILIGEMGLANRTCKFLREPSITVNEGKGPQYKARVVS